MARQYIAVKFRKGDRRSYTYHNDGPPAKVGDACKVPDREGTGWTRVEVVSIVHHTPEFTTKPILGILPPPEPLLI